MDYTGVFAERHLAAQRTYSLDHSVADLMRPVMILCGILTLLVLPFDAVADSRDAHTDVGQKTVLGARNQPLKDGADALIAGDWEEGVRLTHQGLNQAFGKREEEAGLSNLCAGYLQLHKYDTALMYCEMLLARNPDHWRAYNNRALIYIQTKQWDKADADLDKGEELNGGAHTLKVARGMYMDAVYPVSPEIEIDDRKAEEVNGETPK
jgi:tetratricopeptide (TPR) repeat protein